MSAGDEGGRRTIRVSTASGRISVVAEERDDVVVDGARAIEPGDGTTTVDGRSAHVRVRAPSGSRFLLGSTSGRITVEGAAGDVAIVTTSSRIGVEQAETADVRTTSGRVQLGRIAGDCHVRATSSSVAVEAAGKTDIATTSGRITVAEADGDVRARSVSGRIDVSLVGPHAVDAETVSGRIVVEVPDGHRSSDRISTVTDAGRVVVRER